MRCWRKARAQETSRQKGRVFVFVFVLGPPGGGGPAVASCVTGWTEVCSPVARWDVRPVLAGSQLFTLACAGSSAFHCMLSCSLFKPYL